MAKQKSAPQRLLWAQFDALQMGSGWDEEDITKPQILLEDVFGDSHPGSTHLAGLMEQAKYGVFEKGGFPAQYHTTDICDGCDCCVPVCSSFPQSILHSVEDTMPSCGASKAILVTLGLFSIVQLEREIGRASCRERV